MGYSQRAAARWEQAPAQEQQLYVLDVGEFARDISAHSNPCQGQSNCHQLPTAYRRFERSYVQWQ